MIFAAGEVVADDLIVGSEPAGAADQPAGAGHIAAAAPDRSFFDGTARRRRLYSGLRGVVSAQRFDVGT